MTVRTEKIRSCAGVQDYIGDVNSLDFAIKQSIRSLIAGMYPCKVMSNPDGEGYITILPLISQRTVDGREIPYGTIYRIPYAKSVGGKSAIVNPPQEGDIGFAIAASRDISSFKQNKTKAAPPSFRMHNYTDSIYQWCIYPAQEAETTIDMTGGNLVISSKNTITFKGKVEFQDTVTMDSDLNINGNATAKEFTTQDEVALGTHVHNTPEGETGPPMAGKV